MGGRGARINGINGYDAQEFFGAQEGGRMFRDGDPRNVIKRSMGEEVAEFEAALKAELGEAEFNRVRGIFDAWTWWEDREADLKRQIEPLTKSLKSIQVTSGRLWRGGTFTPEYVAALKVGKTIDMGGAASWSAREIVARMYGEERDASGGRTERVIFVNTSNRHRNSIINPYTFPQDEVIVSGTARYKIQRIVSKDQYQKTGGYYDQPVTFVYVKEL